MTQSEQRSGFNIWNAVPLVKSYSEQCSVICEVMSKRLKNQSDGPAPKSRANRRVRSDAQRNLEALLQTAKQVFETSGVDAPVREIARRAGVGIGTLYRHFPQRADLIAAVFRHELDDCADAAPILASKYAPGEAVSRWLQRYAELVATKRGLAVALHSGYPAFDALPGHFDARLRPALRRLLAAAVDAGEIRSDIDSDELLTAVAKLCMSARDDRPDYSRRMVALLVDGLRCRAKPSANMPP
jgi:AcrR family transcriptional regulator